MSLPWLLGKYTHHCYSTSVLLWAMQLILTQNDARNSKINKYSNLSLLKRATSVFTLFRFHRQFPRYIERRMDAVDYNHILSS
jgi:hypothetical protein